MSGRQVDRRTFLTAAGGAAATATLTAGCLGGGDDDSGGDSGGTLVYGRGSDSGTLDPQATTSGEDAKVVQQAYDTVIKFEPGKTTLRAGLAKEYNLDGKSVTLTLREGVNFSNGEEFTAEDFVATYRRFLDTEYEHFIGTENRSYYGTYLLGAVEDVSTDGDYGVTLTLAKKHAPMLRNLAVFAFGIVSKAAIEGDTSLSEDMVGTGPFQFEEWDTANARIRLSANGDYWGEAPKVDEVVFSEIKANSARVRALENDEVDVIDGIGADQRGQIQNAGNAELVSTAGLNVGYMALNMERREEFRSKKVRQALNYAVDTKSIVENVLSGLSVQSSQPIPESMSGHNGDVDPYGHDPDKAQQLLEEAGYPDGFDITLSTFQNPRPYIPSPSDIAQVVKTNLEEVGIGVTLDTQEWESYITYTSEGKHDACFLGWITDNADPDNFLFALLHPGVSADQVPEGQDWISFGNENFNTLNVSAWANRDFIDLVEEAQVLYNSDERLAKYEEASKLVHDEAPWVFLNHTRELRGVHSRVSGFTLAPISGPFLNLCSLE